MYPIHTLSLFVAFIKKNCKKKLKLTFWYETIKVTLLFKYRDNRVGLIYFIISRVCRFENT